jgi:hypothetical protein
MSHQLDELKVLEGKSQAAVYHYPRCFKGGIGYRKQVDKL